MLTDVDSRAAPNNGDEFVATLIALERRLLDPAAGADADALLADGFVEFGRSGTVYDKAATVAALCATGAGPAVVAEDFSARTLGEGVVLLTYRTRRATGEARMTLRSSVWVREGERWRMAFHQGTPAA